ncbi:hypothetical protein QFC22_002215 [Naganishia vaughanmartiniae]|uniref:Uncharacterized protein n=1 Tax=Naganishia vaughanmartiniae TaxID=1424756 RepID=A0ACC2XD78_9TREE|nr:hypothetical protein QFC22_002215 [Naganishia vaughanmartiniae]
MDVDTPSLTSVPETQLETQALSQTETETQTQKSPSDSSRTDDSREPKARQNVVEPDDLAKFQWRREFDRDLEDMALRGIMVADWQVLQHMIKCTLVRNTSAFLMKTPRAKYRPLPNPPHPQRTPLLPATSVDSFAIDDVPMESLRPARETSPSEQQVPSTPGGLIIPPFPPRPPSRRNSQRDGPGRLPVGDSVEVDEEAVIGGRTLKGEMEPSEAWSFLRDLFRSLDEFTVAPPFTIQRICELAWKPFLQHTSIGKYFRALEKNLLVTTTYDVSYGEEDLPEQQASGGFGSLGSVGPNGHRSRASSVSSSSSTSSQSAPLFTPIPFLLDRHAVHPDGTPVPTPATRPRTSSSESDSDVPTTALSLNLKISTHGPQTDNDRDVKMVQAELETENRPDTPIHATSQQNLYPGRDVKKESEKDQQDAAAKPLTLATGIASPAAKRDGSESANGTPTSSLDTVANEPFTGRVDELDAGPLLQAASCPDPSDPHQLHLPQPTDGDVDSSMSAQQHQEGTGERGTMTPHAMADHPQAISSTTDLTAIPPILHSAAHHQPMDTPPASPSGGRTVRGLPRSTSVASSLNDRFVSGEILPPNVPRDDETEVTVKEETEDSEKPGLRDSGGHASKTPKLA